MKTTLNDSKYDRYKTDISDIKKGKGLKRLESTSAQNRKVPSEINNIKAGKGLSELRSDNSLKTHNSDIEKIKNGDGIIVL